MKKNIRGVTVIELLIVITIISLIGITVIPIGAGFLGRNALRNKTSELLSSIRIAQLNSISGKSGGPWGVKVDSSYITLFQGSSYESRNASLDKKFAIPASIVITSTEIIFSAVDGTPSISPTINITGGTDSRSLIINQLGVVDVF